MSVIIASILSGALAFWASIEKAKTKQAHDNLETLGSIPDIPIGGLPLVTLLHHQDAKKRVFVRGVVLPRSSITTNVDDNKKEKTIEAAVSASEEKVVDTLRSVATSQEALVVEERVTHIFNETSYSLITGCSQQESKKVVSRTRYQVPFIIADPITRSSKEYVYVNLEGVEDQVPLENVRSDMKQLLTHAQPGHHLQVDVLTEEEILPLGTVVTAIGLLSSENGVPTIKHDKELPFPQFITTKSKQQLIEELTAEVEQLTDNGKMLSQISVSLAGFALGTFVSHIVRHLMR